MMRRIFAGLGYTAVAVLVVVLTIVLVAYGNDYTYDFATHQVVQKGHVIIESVPSGTVVTADGKVLGKKTPYQAVWSVGQHEFKLERSGYWSWSKTLEVIAGQVSLVNYAILVPKQPPRTVLDSRVDITDQAVSRDHRHLAYVAGGTTPGVYTIDLGGVKAVRLYAPKPAAGETPAEVLEDVSWSDDASHLLIRSKIGSTVTYRLAAASGGEPVDLTSQYKFDFSGLTFSSYSWKQLYWLSPDGLRRVDVDSQSVSAVLADKVTQFWTAPDRILYVQQNDLGRSLWSYDRSGKRQRLIESLPQSDGYSLAYSNYSGQDQLAMVPFSTKVGTLYSAILSDNPTAKVLAHDVTAADFSPDGSTVVFSSENQIVTYDQERTRLIGKPSLAIITDQPGKLQSLTWFDSTHMLAVRDGRLYWFEYDGANRIDLGQVAGTFPALRSSDFRSIVITQPGTQAGAPSEIASLTIRP